MNTWFKYLYRDRRGVCPHSRDTRSLLWINSQTTTIKYQALVLKDKQSPSSVHPHVTMKLLSFLLLAPFAAVVSGTFFAECCHIKTISQKPGYEVTGTTGYTQSCCSPGDFKVNFVSFRPRFLVVS